jgi:hypothetical protein
MSLTLKKGISKCASATTEATNNELPGVRGQARLSLLVSAVVCLMTLRNIIKALSLYTGTAQKLVAVNGSSFSIVLEHPSSNANQSVSTQGWHPATPNATLDSMKIGLYMTTHQSSEHMAFLRQCWPYATQKLRLLQRSHLLYYTSAPTDNDVPHDILSRLVFQNVTIFRYSEVPLAPGHRENRARKQLGAKRAMVDPILNHWFDDYDWIIRLNPDVLIRNDTWLVEKMLDPSVHAILYGFDHNGSPNSALHSDFYAFRPHALTSQPHVTAKFLEEHLANDKMTAEEQMRVLFAKLLENEAQAGNLTAEGEAATSSGRVAWLPGVVRRGSQARMLGLNCPVLHVHRLVHYCPNYFNATDGLTF